MREDIEGQVSSIFPPKEKRLCALSSSLSPDGSTFKPDVMTEGENVHCTEYSQVLHVL